MGDFDLEIVRWREVADSVLLEVNRTHDINDIKHLRTCYECSQLQGKLEDDGREESEDE